MLNPSSYPNPNWKSSRILVLCYTYICILQFPLFWSDHSAYVSGLSVTYGSPRSHIWTFAAGYSKNYNYNCNCALHPGVAATPFVGENTFCESGNTGPYESQWYLDDPLWDSQGCVSGSTCCRGSLRFTTTASQKVRDDIEKRICSHYALYIC